MPLFRLRHQIEPDFFCPQCTGQQVQDLLRQNDTTIRAGWNLKGGIRRLTAEPKDAENAGGGSLFLQYFSGRIERVPASHGARYPGAGDSASATPSSGTSCSPYENVPRRRNHVVCVRGNISSVYGTRSSSSYEGAPPNDVGAEEAGAWPPCPEPPTTCSARSRRPKLPG